MAGSRCASRVDAIAGGARRRKRQATSATPVFAGLTVFILICHAGWSFRRAFPQEERETFRCPDASNKQFDLRAGGKVHPGEP